jgi:hypothetical protein
VSNVQQFKILQWDMASVTYEVKQVMSTLSIQVRTHHEFTDRMREALSVEQRTQDQGLVYRLTLKKNGVVCIQLGSATQWKRVEARNRSLWLYRKLCWVAQQLWERAEDKSLSDTYLCACREGGYVMSWWRDRELFRADIKEYRQALKVFKKVIQLIGFHTTH